jgi:hypothetical protein
MHRTAAQTPLALQPSLQQHMSVKSGRFQSVRRIGAHTLWRDCVVTNPKQRRICRHAAKAAWDSAPAADFRQSGKADTEQLLALLKARQPSKQTANLHNCFLSKPTMHSTLAEGTGCCSCRQRRWTRHSALGRDRPWRPWTLDHACCSADAVSRRCAIRQVGSFACTLSTCNCQRVKGLAVHSLPLAPRRSYCAPVYSLYAPTCRIVNGAPWLFTIVKLVIGYSNVRKLAAGLSQKISCGLCTTVPVWCMWASKQAITHGRRQRYMSCCASLPQKARQSSGSREVTLTSLVEAGRKCSTCSSVASKYMLYQVQHSCPAI